MSDRIFVDREPQISELRALADASGPRLALLYGRRRIGKTFLLDHVWGDDRRFYFLAADTTADQNRRELLRELATWSGREIDPGDYPSWRTVFRQLAAIAAERPLVIILDEFQYLMGHEEDVVSQLNAVWDREVAGRNLTLVLCGSQVSTMAALEAGDSPLYGRIHWREQLGPFDYFDAASMMPRSWSDRDRAVAYGIWGGTPRYLAAIEPAEPLADAVRRTILSTRGEVHLQLENLIEQEKGIRFPGDYRAVLTAVARGRTGITEIANGAGLGDRRDVARRALETLEELQLVRRERNFGAGRTTAWRYRIADNAVRFWYHFVHPNRSRIETGEIESVWEHAIHPGLDTYTRPIFEIMAKEGFRRLRQGWGLPAIDEWQRWEGHDRDRRPIEIDIVARLGDGKMLTGEVKWSSSPVGEGLHNGLVRDLESLAQSGQPWARHALDGSRSHGHIFISAAGFTDTFQSLAQSQAIRLVRLSELYESIGD